MTQPSPTIAANMTKRAAEVARSVEGKIDRTSGRDWRHFIATQKDGDYTWACVYVKIDIILGPEGGFRRIAPPQLLSEEEALGAQDIGDALIFALDIGADDLAAQASRRILLHYEAMREGRAA